MPMNRVQFQPGLSLAGFLKSYGTEAQCEEALFAARWPRGFRCPDCGAEHAYALRRGARRLWQCAQCRHQSSLLAGSLFEATKLPLTTWFLAMFLITQAKNNISALALKRALGVSYPTAWLLKHKLMQIMAQRERTRALDGRVELDDAYLGGYRPGPHGRGSPNKVPFLTAVQTDSHGHPLYVRFDLVRAFSKPVLQSWGEQGLRASARVLSDGLYCFEALAPIVADHQAIHVGHGPQAARHPSFRWANTLIGNLKRALSGTYHAFNYAKYGQRYLAEYAYRFNRRFDMTSILPRLAYTCARARPVPERILRAAAVSC
jgi:ribosomal protein L37AE/L43A